MSKKRSSSVSSNSSEDEIDFLENEFLKIKIDDNHLAIPIPKEEIKIYEDEVLEVMKSGCNRQIAEYALMEYKKIEDKEEGPKLFELKDEYKNTKKDIFEKIKQQVKDSIGKNKDSINNDEQNKDLYDFDDEIQELLDICKEEIKNTDNKGDSIEKCIKSCFLNILQSKEEDNIKFLEKKKKFNEKRDAVIESALRRVKKIVNDENEYKIFYKDYYGKDDEKEE